MLVLWLCFSGCDGVGFGGVVGHWVCGLGTGWLCCWRVLTHLLRWWVLVWCVCFLVVLLFFGFVSLFLFWLLP